MELIAVRFGCFWGLVIWSEFFSGILKFLFVFGKNLFVRGGRLGICKFIFLFVVFIRSYLWLNFTEVDELSLRGLFVLRNMT